MKRIISAILVCVLMLGCVLALVSCGGPKKNPEKAKAALEKAGYTVMFADENLGEELEATIYAISEDGEDVIAIAYYAKKADAKEAYKEAKEDLEDGYKAGRSGKVVWMGTKAAIKAAK